MTLGRRNTLIKITVTAVMTALSIVLNLFVYNNPYGLIDCALIVICSLLIHLLQSRVAAIILTAYAALNVIVVTIQTGRLGGWWIAVVGIYAIIYTFKFQKAWKEYKNGGAVDINLPQ